MNTRRLAVPLWALMLLVAPRPSLAQYEELEEMDAADLDPMAADDDGEGDSGGPLEIGGNVKTFMVGVFPYKHFFMPPDPVVSGFASGRLKLKLKAGEYVTMEAHPVLLGSTAAGGAALGFVQTGLGGARPEAIDLSTEFADSQLGRIQLVMDRAVLSVHLPHVDISLGRQPVSFGQGYFFTPMDLVAPFSPGTIDREYKQGVDAVRTDAYLGTANQLTFVAAYAGGWDLEGLVFASHMRVNVENLDVGVFAAEARKDAVVGVDAATDLMGVALRGEGTMTFPDNRADDVFLRGVLGADMQLPKNASISGEFYVQTLGARRPADYVGFSRNKRFGRGELWLMGQTYVAGSFSWEITPLLRPSAAAIISLTDGSFFLSPTLSWSVADEVDVNLGAQIVWGPRPKDVHDGDLIHADGTPKNQEEIQALYVPRSEFGLYPNTGFVQTRVYF